MSITGERDDLPGGGPQKVGVAIADVLTGMYATIAILAALNSRSVTGLGQYIDMALLDCVVALGGNQVTGFFVSGKVPHRYGNAHASLVPYQVFESADGQIIVAVGNDAQWRRYCEAIDRQDLADDVRYAKVTGRIVGRDALITELSRTMRTESTATWIARLEAAGVPCGPVNDYGQTFADPQVIHRGLRVDVPRADGAFAGTIASPLRLVDTPPVYERGPPTLGEDTGEILASILGKSEAEIADLRARQII